MKKITTVLTAGALLISGLTFAADAKPMAKHMMAKSMTCPACHMKMMTVKSAGAPVAVKTPKGTFYCCAGCAAGKAHMKPMTHKM